MALTTTEEAQLRDLIAKQAELLSLATAEPTIISKLGATKKNISTVTPATVLADADLTFVRQGTQDKSSTLSTLLNYMADNLGFGASLTANGWQDLPSGLIIQWGTGITNGTGVFAGSFPKAFPNACFIVNPVDLETIAANIGYGAAVFTNSTFTISFARGGLAYDANNVSYFAIGW